MSKGNGLNGVIITNAVIATISALVGITNYCILQDVRDKKNRLSILNKDVKDIDESTIEQINKIKQAEKIAKNIVNISASVAAITAMTSIMAGALSAAIDIEDDEDTENAEYIEDFKYGNLDCENETMYLLTKSAAEAGLMNPYKECPDYLESNGLKYNLLSNQIESINFCIHHTDETDDFYMP